LFLHAENWDLCRNLLFFYDFLAKKVPSSDIRQREALPLKPEGVQAKPTGLSRAEYVPVRFSGHKDYNCSKDILTASHG